MQAARAATATLAHLSAKRWRTRPKKIYELHPEPETVIAKVVASAHPRGLHALWVLIVYLCRKHTGPEVIGRAFCLDRRALAELADLSLTESQVRTAIKNLEKVGLIVRQEMKGTHRRVNGKLVRKPILWRLGGALVSVFRKLHAANPFNKPKSNFSAKQNVPLGEVAAPQELQVSPEDRIRLAATMRNFSSAIKNAPEPGKESVVRARKYVETIKRVAFELPRLMPKTKVRVEPREPFASQKGPYVPMVLPADTLATLPSRPSHE